MKPQVYTTYLSDINLVKKKVEHLYTEYADRLLEWKVCAYTNFNKEPRYYLVYVLGNKKELEDIVC